jgi:hypothetical protein
LAMASALAVKISVRRSACPAMILVPRRLRAI